ncbi:SGNH/GDSL hydrolase family protein [Aquincola sp. J276]|uniref:SGNH/GDSL hydrolase family protein n=1 Tax=Aquincola sp. J276 TaxID=2898432 RepID=UPI002150B523|nr:SGNH/GDSL hydrolase family protein [Aquincola sp. J276]MCR5866471.1 hypothetical protein [Aquincola sp. J276]
MNFKFVWRGAAALAVAALLSACGGGQVDEFKPKRIIAFGDEQSLVTADGKKYSVNLATTSDTTDQECRTYPVWTQIVAAEFGLSFPGCRTAGAADNGVMKATVNAKVEDFARQISEISSTFTDDDLTTVMVGTHDVLEQYALYPAKSKEAILAELRTRGTRWGELVNSIAEAGPRVQVVTIPDLGLTPFAIAEKAAATAAGAESPDRQALLTELVAAYNLAMRLALIQDGRMIGLVFGEIETQQMVRYPGSYRLSNVVKGVCAVDLPNCTSTTVIPEVTSGDPVTEFLWADSIRPGIEFHDRLGDLAYYRSNNNPF